MKLSLDTRIPFSVVDIDAPVPYRPTGLFDPRACRFFLAKTTARMGADAQSPRATVSLKRAKRHARGGR